MDGLVDFALKLVENLLLLLSLAKETFAYAVPDELGKAIEYLWKGLIGSSSWLGYAMAAGYFVGTDYGFGEGLCDAYGYGFYVIDGINYIVAFAKPAEDSSGASAGLDISGLVSAGVGAAAGAAGLDSKTTAAITGAATAATKAATS